MRADAGNSDDYLNDEELAADAAVNDTFLRSQIFSIIPVLRIRIRRIRMFFGLLDPDPDP